MNIVKSTYMGLIAAMCFSGPVSAQMEIYKDYELADSVWQFDTIKVAPGMGEDYLEGLKETWVEANAIAKKLGHIEDYFILASALPESGDFNLVLVVKYKDMAALAPDKAKYQAFMKEWTDKQDENSREKVMKDYPRMREITGQYLMNQVMMK